MTHDQIEQQQQQQQQVTAPRCSINVEFTGGLDTLFPSRRLALKLPQSIGTMRDLIAHLASEHLMTSVNPDAPSLFIQNDSVRPGILVLINDADWELEGSLDYTLTDGDDIVFISTLHGG